MALSFITLLALAQPVYSLGWKDKEWVGAGCPENIYGQWIARSKASWGGTTATVSNNLFTLPSKTGGTDSINFEKLSESAIATVLALKTLNLPTRKQVLPFLKIRPHLVTTKGDQGVHTSSQAECLIKVFQYQSQDQIRSNKYAKWNIYQIKTLN